VVEAVLAAAEEVSAEAVDVVVDAAGASKGEMLY
jgi:hypothetical protein